MFYLACNNYWFGRKWNVGDVKIIKISVKIIEIYFNFYIIIPYFLKLFLQIEKLKTLLKTFRNNSQWLCVIS